WWRRGRWWSSHAAASIAAPVRSDFTWDRVVTAAGGTDPVGQMWRKLLSAPSAERSRNENRVVCLESASVTEHPARPDTGLIHRLGRLFDDAREEKEPVVH